MKADGALRENLTRKYLQQILEVVSYLHKTAFGVKCLEFTKTANCLKLPARSFLLSKSSVCKNRKNFL